MATSVDPSETGSILFAQVYAFPAGLIEFNKTRG